MRKLNGILTVRIKRTCTDYGALVVQELNDGPDGRGKDRSRADEGRTTVDGDKVAWKAGIVAILKGRRWRGVRSVGVDGQGQDVRVSGIARNGSNLSFDQIDAVCKCFTGRHLKGIVVIEVGHSCGINDVVGQRVGRVFDQEINRLVLLGIPIEPGTCDRCGVVSNGT